MIPRFGAPPDPNRRYTLRPGAYAILPRFGEVLLTSQYDDPPDIQLPGGGIDPGESARATLFREVYEETGWSIANPVRFGVFRRFVFMPEYDLWAEKVCHVYVARPVRRLGPPLETDHAAMWLPIPAAIAVLGNPGDRMLLKQFAGL